MGLTPEMMPVREATQDEEVRRCFPAFHELRPHLVDAGDLVARWHRQRSEGYRIAYIEHEGDVVAAAGFRIMTTLASGKILYLDDLVACASHHSRGFGTRLLTWLQERVEREGCAAQHLDSGYHRHAAHKAYLRNGFQLHSHHLSWQVRRP